MSEEKPTYTTKITMAKASSADIEGLRQFLDKLEDAIQTGSFEKPEELAGDDLTELQNSFLPLGYSHKEATDMAQKTIQLSRDLASACVFDEEFQRNIGCWVINNIEMISGRERVIFGYETMFANACDETLGHLEFKPQINAALAHYQTCPAARPLAVTPENLLIRGFVEASWTAEHDLAGQVYRFGDMHKGIGCIDCAIYPDKPPQIVLWTCPEGGVRRVPSLVRYVENMAYIEYLIEMFVLPKANQKEE